MLRVALLLAGIAAGWAVIPAADTAAPADTAAAADARLVRAEVRFAGKLLLHTSTSDDGHADVDAVWQYLPGLAFEATPAFDELRSAREGGADGWTLRRGEHDDWIELRIDYGGRGELRALSFVRDGERWRLVADEVAAHADRRWIRRSAVPALGGRK